MIDVQNVTEEEACKNLKFLLTMTERNRTVWRIKSPEGAVAILGPVVQSGPPIDPEVLDQVEEFKKALLEETDL